MAETINLLDKKTEKRKAQEKLECRSANSNEKQKFTIWGLEGSKEMEATMRVTATSVIKTRKKCVIRFYNRSTFTACKTFHYKKLVGW